MKRIYLASDKGMALVDDTDFVVLGNFRWWLSGRGYVMRTEGRKGEKKFYLHREIMGAKSKDWVDHINRDKLDNRKKNLRVCSPSQNMANRPMNSKNKTGYKGVFIDKRTGAYVAKICIKYKGIYLGYFHNPKLAAKAYNDAAIKYFGKFAWLNPI